MQMDNFGDFLGVRKIDRMANAWVRELCGVKKRVGERLKDSRVAKRTSGPQEKCIRSCP